MPIDGRPIFIFGGYFYVNGRHTAAL